MRIYYKNKLRNESVAVFYAEILTINGEIVLKTKDRKKKSFFLHVSSQVVEEIELGGMVKYELWTVEEVPEEAQQELSLLRWDKKVHILIPALGPAKFFFIC